MIGVAFLVLSAVAVGSVIGYRIVMTVDSWIARLSRNRARAAWIEAWRSLPRR